MTADTTQAPLAMAEPPPTPHKALRLGFNTRVSFNSGPGGALRGLRDGIALFQAAERLGFQSGWAYQRHFDNYLSSPLPFFAAAGQYTERITLGSAVIPMRYQDPILLAEGAATTDLLIGGRLNLALSSGRTGFEPVFGHEKVDARAGEYQAQLIAAYRAAWPGPEEAPPVAVAASVLPATTPELAEKYAAYDYQRRTEGPSASKPKGALNLTMGPSRPPGMLVSPVFHGDPDSVAKAILADPGIAAADELVLFLPPAFVLEENLRVLTDMAETVGPALGWTPAQ
jgi:alkanesulfonate monooxygenase SsuD/methylene tetrahydromethanopterin reductase-like flavin-dependent oxidoreductase (luciferase family)